MHTRYHDIYDRVAEPVSWFDDRGVPRYSRFTPGQLGNIHADEAAFAEISCQSCGRHFQVALTGAFADRGFSLSDCRIELALAHSRPMLDHPDALIDAGRLPRSVA